LEISAEFPETPKSAGKWSGCKIPQKIPWEYLRIFLKHQNPQVILHNDQIRR
jgi:hypothetical protein